jgi:pimeloyl-ACP methyl ester carboxylesterase
MCPLLKIHFFAWLSNIETISLNEIVAFGKTNNPAWAEVEFPAWAESKSQLDKNIFPALSMQKPWREFVAALTVPTLLITADVTMNAIITPAAAQEAATLSPLLQVAPVPNAGHNIRRENYPAFMKAVQAFLSQLIITNTD